MEVSPEGTKEEKRDFFGNPYISGTPSGLFSNILLSGGLRLRLPSASPSGFSKPVSLSNVFVRRGLKSSRLSRLLTTGYYFPSIRFSASAVAW